MHVAVMTVLIGHTFINATVTHHFKLYSNYNKLEAYFNVYLLQVKVFQVSKVELDAPGFSEVMMNASDIMACIDLYNSLIIKHSKVSHHILEYGVLLKLITIKVIGSAYGLPYYF